MIPPNIQTIIQDRCLVCHEYIEGKNWSNESQLRAHAQSLLAKLTDGSMPPGNSTNLTDKERSTLIEFLKSL